MVEIDKSLCVGCGLCVKDCVFESLTLEDGKVVYNGSCVLCGHCVAVCPANAVAIPSYDMAEVEACGPLSPKLDIDTLLHTIKARRSIRFYKDRKIEQDKLENIVQAGRYTATGKNAQNCTFVVIQDRLEEFKALVWQELEKLSAAPGNTPNHTVQLINWLLELRREQNTDYLFRNAPAVFYVASTREADAVLASQNMELAMVAQDLGMLFNGYLIRLTKILEEACRWMDVRSSSLALCMLAGYPDVKYLRTAPRRQAKTRWL